MAANKKNDPLSSIKGTLPAAAPWIALGINVVAAVTVLISYYKKEVDRAFMVPYTHVHYVDPNGKYICGDKYINSKHICDGRFLNIRAEIPDLDTFLKLGFTKEQWDSTQKILKQFKCEGPSNAQGD